MYTRGSTDRQKISGSCDNLPQTAKAEDGQIQSHFHSVQGLVVRKCCMLCNCIDLSC